MNECQIDKIYFFHELPEETQKDFLIQYEDDRQFNPDDYIFCLRIISYSRLLEELDEKLDNNLIDAMDDDYIIQLAKDIEINGLMHPPIGSEGNHRSLAFLHLKQDMLRYEVIELIEIE